MGKKYNRRSFFKRAIGVIALLELVYVFYEFTGRKKILKKSKNLFSAGNISLFEKGNIYPFSSGHFYLSCLNDGGFLAISAILAGDFKLASSIFKLFCNTTRCFWWLDST